MPLYEYECEGCGRRFEVIRKFSDPPLDRCDACGGTVRKLLSSPAIQFKGSGFYINDYARKSGDRSGSGESTSSKGESTSSKGESTSSKGESTSSKGSAGSSSERAPAPASTPASTKDS